MTKDRQMIMMLESFDNKDDNDDDDDLRTVSCPSSPACRSYVDVRAALDAVVSGQHTRHDVLTISTERRRPQSLLATPHGVVVPATPDSRDRRQSTTQARLPNQTIHRLMAVDCLVW